MKIERFSYIDQRWSCEAFPALDSAQSLVIVFGASTFLHDAKPFSELQQAYPQSVITGCSTSGEIHGLEIQDNSLSVAVIQFANARCKIAYASVDDMEQSKRAGEELAAALDGDDLKSVFVLSDGLMVNGSELVRGLNSQLAASVLVTGGLAGDGKRFEETWVLHDGLPKSHLIAAIGFYGDDSLTIAHGSKGGWDIFGPERLVTRSAGNVLFELDNKPALTLYKEYLGEMAAELPASGLLFPLALRQEDGSQKQLVRTILAVDEEAQSMTFAGDIPEGAYAQLMRANFDHLVDGAEGAALMAQKNANEPEVAQLCIAISCVGRRLVLGERTEEEIEAVLDILPEGTEQIGFYSYGELSPYASGSCDLHNQTMTLTTIYER